MDKYLLIQTTTDNDKWTTNLVKALLENKLSADVQVSSIDSHYWWKGKVNNKVESLLSIKTRADLFEQVKATIKEYSEYEVPQIIATPIVAGSSDYLNWIKESTCRFVQNKKEPK
ncbi:MAG: divalent-cation tolerance protein CutA [Alphaproteobacteria bacterium]|nr:divalent-cation tolerance protein CutA [Alphaproteobacteria bacterium]